MKKFALLAAAILFAAAPALAAEKTLTGVISDAKCGGKHMKAEHGSQMDSDHDCVTKCVAGGSKYVLVVGSKTYDIANQDFEALKDHGGHRVRMSGDVKGNTITVSKIEMASAGKGTKEKSK